MGRFGKEYWLMSRINLVYQDTKERRGAGARSLYLGQSRLVHIARDKLNTLDLYKVVQEVLKLNLLGYIVNDLMAWLSCGILREWGMK
jgi:hypothetical protein